MWPPRQPNRRRRPKVRLALGRFSLDFGLFGGTVEDKLSFFIYFIPTWLLYWIDVYRPPIRDGGVRPDTQLPPRDQHRDQQPPTQRRVITLPPREHRDGDGGGMAGGRGSDGYGSNAVPRDFRGDNRDNRGAFGGGRPGFGSSGGGGADKPFVRAADTSAASSQQTTGTSWRQQNN